MNIVVGYNDNHVQSQSRMVCKFYQRGMCRFGNRCRNAHSEVGHSEAKRRPRVPEQRKTDSQNNVPKQELPRLSLESNASSNETPMETGPSTSSSEGAASNTSKECGICFDTIMEKQNRWEQTYGILPNCNHCFCFTCIRKWRQSKEFDLDVSKACPECRKPSDYVYPSKKWFEQKQEKDNFISKEKVKMQKIDCKYFNKGKGSCPFGNTCLYLHALPNGKKINVGPPRPRRRRTSNIEAEMMYQLLYWLNDDEDIEMDEEDDDEDDDFDDNSFELDLDDPTIAMQYYDHDDIRRYIAIDRLMNESGDTDSDSDDTQFPWFM